MSRLLRLVLCCLVVAAGCRKAPAPPSTGAPGTVEAISGQERIGWDQRAADAVELAAARFALYVDGARTELAGASCGQVSSGAGFPCSAPLPPLSPGAHSLQLASFVDDGGVLESARSTALRVTVSPAINLATVPGGTDDAYAWSGSIVTTSDRVKMRAELVAGGLDEPTDLAFTPDGRLFVAERTGRIRMLRGGRLLPDPAVSIADLLGADGPVLALAVDPRFDRSGHLFAIYTALSRSGEPTFSLARFREVGDTLGDPAVLLDGVPASAAPSASLRFGADGKLYAAFDAGGDPRRAGDMASPNGKILRLETDGTTPDDQTGATPLFSDGFGSPGGFDWDPRSGTLWAADAVGGASRLRAIVPGARTSAGKVRGELNGIYRLPSTTIPSSTVFYRGPMFPAFATSLLVASDAGRHLLRVQLDPRASAQPPSVERLLQDIAGGLRAIAIGPEGAIYFATANAIGRLVPDVK